MKYRSGNIAFVVVTYNRAETLKICLQSILDQTGGDAYSIIVIDNNSSDQTEATVMDFIKDYPTLFQYIKLHENIGGAGGFERGCKEAYKQGFEWFFLLDDDVMLDSECLSNVAKNFQKNCLIAVREDLNGNLAEYGALNFDFSNPFCLNPKRSTIATTYGCRSELPELLEVDSGSFEGFIVNRSVIEKVGFPRKEYFIFGDDTDFSLRIKKAGYNLYAVRDAKIIRLLPFNRYSTTPWKAYYRWRNFFTLHFLFGENLLVKIKPFFLVWVLVATCLFKHYNLSPTNVLIDSIKLYKTLKSKK